MSFVRPSVRPSMGAVSKDTGLASLARGVAKGGLRPLAICLSPSVIPLKQGRGTLPGVSASDTPKPPG